MQLLHISQSVIGGENVNSVTARELYSFLELDKSQFSRWATRNIVDNDFAIENEDYIGFDISVEGNEVMDYALDIDFAYKIAMRSKGKKAEQIRDWFIKIKNDLKYKSIQPKLPTNPLDLFRLTLETLESQNAQLQVVNDKIEKLEHSTTIDHARQQKLQKNVSIRVQELITKHNLPDGTKHGLFASIYGNLKEKYKVPSYRDIPKIRFEEAISDICKTELKASV